MSNRMNDTEESFVKDLKKLLDRYNARLDRNENYDGNEDCIGATYFFSGNDIYIELSDLFD